MANKTTVFKSGHSIATTIPRFICELRGIAAKSELEWLFDSHGRIVVQVIRDEEPIKGDEENTDKAEEVPVDA